MKTIEISLYKFEELKEEAKERAIENNFNTNVYDEWYDLSIDEFTRELKNMGFLDVEVSFSGFHSQGDGASFTADRIDLIKLSEHIKFRPMVKKLIDSGEIYTDSGSVYRINHHYVHEKSTDWEFYCECIPHLSEGENIKQYVDDLVNEFLNSFVLDKNKEIYKTLNDEYNYLTSEEAIKETLIANDYDFTENGEMY